MKKTILALVSLLLISMVWATDHWTESFENPDIWSGYTTGTVTFDSGTWDFVSVFPEQSSDSYDGVKACRINDDVTGASITAPAVNTLGAVSFYYHKPFSGTGTFDLQISEDGGAFTTLASEDYSDVTTPTFYSYNVNNAGSNIQVRILNDDYTAHLTIDYVTLTDFDPSGNQTPSITQITSVPSYPTSTDAVDVTATITDADGTITATSVFWGLTSEDLSNEITMSETATPDVYQTDTQIPAQVAGSVVYFEIQATDNEPETTISTEHNYTVAEQVSIYDIQYTVDPSGDSPHMDQVVATNGIVTAIYGSYFVLQNGTGAWNGLWIDSSETVALGDDVTVSGTVVEAFDNTEINSPEVVVNSNGNPLPAASVITSGAVNAEEYEGVLVTVNDAQCTNPDLNYGEWEIDDGIVRTPCVVDDMGDYDVTPALGIIYDVTGPVYYSYGNYKIEPRDENDVVQVGNALPIIENVVQTPVTVTTSDAVSVSADVTDSDGSISLVELHWGLASGSLTNIIDMSLTGRANYTTDEDIPAQAEGQTVYYEIYAEDDIPASTTSSEYDYTVVPVYSISITSPIGGESWEQGSSHNITWSSVGFTETDDVLLYARYNFGFLGPGSYQSTAITNSNPIPNNGLYAWGIAADQEIFDDYKIYAEISDATNNADDYSETFFIIEPIVVTYDVVINEFDTHTSSYEYLELYNLTDSDINLATSGYSLVFYNGNGDVEYQSTGLTGILPASGFYVIAESGVSDLYGYTPDQNAGWTSFQNGTDAAALVSGAGQVDAVIYGSSADTGLETLLNLPGILLSANSSGSSSRITDGQGGNTYSISDWDVFATRTPGATNVAAPPTYTPYTIVEIQTPGAGGDISQHAGETIETTGIVTAIGGYFYFIQDGATDFAGVYVYDSPGALALGDNVTIKGSVNEYNGLTQITSLTETIVNSGGNTLPTPIILSTNAVNAEEYEGVLVTSTGTCSAVSGNPGSDHWLFMFDDGTGTAYADDGIYSATVSAGLEYTVTGPVTYYYSNYQILPREAADVVETGVGEPSITVTSPNGGESWQRNNSHEITWDTTLFTVDADVSIYYNDGGAGGTITPVVLNTGSFMWDIPDDMPLASDYIIDIYIEEEIESVWIDASDVSDAAFSIIAEQAVPEVVINEIDVDQTSTDTHEFVELYDGGLGNQLLDGLVVVLFNGNGDVSYNAYDLDGYSTDENGYFLIGNDSVDPLPAYTIPTSTLQNGVDAVAVYEGNDTDFPNGTPVTAVNLMDAIVYDTNDADDAGLLDVLLNPGEPQVNEAGGGDSSGHSNQRIPNGTGGAMNTSTYAQSPPTPGAVNVYVADLTIPENVVITYGANVTVTWDEVASATAYVVYVSEDPYAAGPWTIATGTFDLVTDPARPTWTETATTGAKNFYKVAASND